MIISLRMLKNSHMTLPRSPILPMQIPKVMKKPIKPEEDTTQHVSSSSQCKSANISQIKQLKEEVGRSSTILSPRTFMPHLYSSFFLFSMMGSVWFSTITGTFFSTV